MQVVPVLSVVQRVETWRPYINKEAVAWGVRQSLIEAVIHQESGGDPDAFRVEPAIGDASFGLMQLLLRTARSLGFAGPPRELFLPAVNITLGTHYLHDLQANRATLHAVLLCYNGGPGAVRRYGSGERGFPADRYADNVEALEAFYAMRNAAKAGD